MSQATLFELPPTRDTAVLSPCGKYRYRLTRALGMPAASPARTVAWLMLNPSVATAEIDDPTIHKVIGFSQRWGFDDAVVVNLFALVSTLPAGLLAVDDPVGPENDVHIHRAVAEAEFIVCAWGASVTCCKAARKKLLPRVQVVRDMLDRRRLRCLGLTADEQPRHPVRLAYETELQRYTGRHPPMTG